jgi:hypothetical protein
VARVREQRRHDPGDRGTVEVGAHGLGHLVKLTPLPHAVAARATMGT